MKILNQSRFVTAFILSFFCLSVNGFLLYHSEANENRAATLNTMHQNFEGLMCLQEYAADNAKFSDPSNHDKIQACLDQISDLKHVFTDKIKNTEPGLAAISSLFGEYLQEVKIAFRANAHGSFIQNRIKTLSGFCLSCHSRLSTNESFKNASDKIEASSLTRFQKADFLAATRQFDKAIAAYEAILVDSPDSEMKLAEFSKSVRSLLNITVRVKQDSNKTLEILTKLSKRKDIPPYFQHYITSWVKEASAWKNEPVSGSTEPQLMNKARLMMARAAKLQLFPADPSGDINYLRATNLIHETLHKNPKSQFRAEALYLLGSCYDALQDPLLWALDSLYFEACVREFPHTQSAQKCYKRYATKLYFGYSGSGGTYIPEDEQKKLAELRKLSE